jgi:hypothetical protein
MIATPSKPKIYDPAFDTKVSFEDAVSYYVNQFGMPRAKAELHIQMKRDGGDNITRRELPDGTIIIQES